MKSYHSLAVRVAALMILLSGAAPGSGFSLLGPYEPWMDTTNGFHQNNDIGGPMAPGNGYRWNVPVVSYSFTPSFLDYFGSNGVAAVEGAIAILNALPDASAMNLTNYPLASQQINLVAQSENLLDLKSETLGLLLEQLGLASPTENAFVLREWNPGFGTVFLTQSSWPSNTVPTYVCERNYDPLALTPSLSVDGVLYTCVIDYWNAPNTNPPIASISPVLVDPFATGYPAVADFLYNARSGGIYANLTRDDAGGLGYLLNETNTQVESLIAGVTGSGTNAGNFVNTALRQGVGKITFVRQTGDFLLGMYFPITNQFVDTYLTNGVKVSQTLQRIITQPDILFTADSTGLNAVFSRTGTSNWINNAAANGTPGGAGPGVIRPPVTIDFNPGTVLSAGGGNPTNIYANARWATYDHSTNPPVLYPIGAAFSGSASAQISLKIDAPGNAGAVPLTRNFTWTLPEPDGTNYLLQTSQNLANWVTITNFTNEGLGFSFEYTATNGEAPRYFRFTPVP